MIDLTKFGVLFDLLVVRKRLLHPPHKRQNFGGITIPNVLDVFPMNRDNYKMQIYDFLIIINPVFKRLLQILRQTRK